MYLELKIYINIGSDLSSWSSFTDVSSMPNMDNKKT